MTLNLQKQGAVLAQPAVRKDLFRRRPHAKSVPASRRSQSSSDLKCNLRSLRAVEASDQTPCTSLTETQECQHRRPQIAPEGLCARKENCRRISQNECSTWRLTLRAANLIRTLLTSWWSYTPTLLSTTIQEWTKSSTTMSKRCRHWWHGRRLLQSQVNLSSRWWMSPSVRIRQRAVTPVSINLLDSRQNKLRLRWKKRGTKRKRACRRRCSSNNRK